MASPNAARDCLTMRLAPRDHEVFTILFLDSRHRLIACLEIFRGTIDGASVHPREVVKGEPHAANASLTFQLRPCEHGRADALITRSRERPEFAINAPSRGSKSAAGVAAAGVAGGFRYR